MPLWWLFGAVESRGYCTCHRNASRAKEADLRAEDLANGFMIGNASRGLIAARLA
jgi:hypothetical protein